MKLIIKYLKPYKTLVLLNIISIFGFALAELGIPTLISDMIDEGVLRQDSQYLFRTGLIMACIALIGVCGTILLGYCCAKISTSVTRDIRNDVFRKVQTFSHAQMNEFGVSSLITRTNNDAYQIMVFLNVILRTALLTPVMFFVSFTLTIQSNLQLSMIIASTIPLIILGVILVGRFSEPISEKQQGSLDRLNRIFRENLTGIRVIRAFNNDAYESVQKTVQADVQYGTDVFLCDESGGFSHLLCGGRYDRCQYLTSGKTDCLYGILVSCDVVGDVVLYGFYDVSKSQCIGQTNSCRL